MQELQAKYTKRYEWARTHLLAMLVLTTVNIVWLLIDPSAASLFSASLPQMAARAGVMLYLLDMPLYLVILCGMAVVLLLVAYLLCWIFSKKHGGWMVAAMVLFGVDMAAMVYLVVSSFVQAAAEGLLPNLFTTGIWVLFQVWVMVFLVRGVIAWRKLHKSKNTLG